jgi:hypothetical protein
MTPIGLMLNLPSDAKVPAIIKGQMPPVIHHFLNHTLTHSVGTKPALARYFSQLGWRLSRPWVVFA